MPPDRELHERTREIYDRQAENWDAGRSREFFERGWFLRFGACLPPGGRVLDLGCGAGEPVAAWLAAQGFGVTGADFSGAMLSIARSRVPGGDWRRIDMRALDLPDRFDGIVGWDSFFHLTPAEQRETLPRLARHLAPGGALMLTVGPDASEATGSVGGEPVYHASLSRAEYDAILSASGLRLAAFTAEDPDCDFHSVLLAVAQAEGTVGG